MSMSPQAGNETTPDMLVDMVSLIDAYYTGHPDPSVRSQQVAFGTSGHRGSSLDSAFNEDHIVATTAAAQVREVQLGLRLRWRTHTPSGREVTPPAELTLSRDMSYTESQALAKQYEEADLYREMQSDIVAQVMRRLAAVRL